MFNDFYSNEDIKERILELKKYNKIPNILLVGPSGSGKTFLIKKIVNNYHPNNILYVNLYDLDKKKIKNTELFLFLNKVSTRKGIVVLDNYNSINEDKQFILRSLVKRYQNRTFIISVNNDNIINTLKQNFTKYSLQLPNKKDLMLYIDNNTNIKLTKLQKEIILEDVTNYAQCNMIMEKINLFENFNTKELKNLTDNHKQIIKKICRLLKTNNIKSFVLYIDKLIIDYSISEIMSMINNNTDKIGKYLLLD
jgi:adenylate kinase family enzyme